MDADVVRACAWIWRCKCEAWIRLDVDVSMYRYGRSQGADAAALDADADVYVISGRTDVDAVVNVEGEVVRCLNIQLIEMLLVDMK